MPVVLALHQCRRAPIDRFEPNGSARSSERLGDIFSPRSVRCQIRLAAQTPTQCASPKSRLSSTALFQVAPHLPPQSTQGRSSAKPPHVRQPSPVSPRVQLAPQTEHTTCGILFNIWDSFLNPFRHFLWHFVSQKYWRNNLTNRCPRFSPGCIEPEECIRSLRK